MCHCGNGYYNTLLGDKCLRCHPTCAECTGPSANECIYCKVPLVLVIVDGRRGYCDCKTGYTQKISNVWESDSVRDPYNEIFDVAQPPRCWLKNCKTPKISSGKVTHGTGLLIVEEYTKCETCWDKSDITAAGWAGKSFYSEQELIDMVAAPSKPFQVDTASSLCELKCKPGFWSNFSSTFKPDSVYLSQDILDSEVKAIRDDSTILIASNGTPQIKLFRPNTSKVDLFPSMAINTIDMTVTIVTLHSMIPSSIVVDGNGYLTWYHRNFATFSVVEPPWFCGQISAVDR